MPKADSDVGMQIERQTPTQLQRQQQPQQKLQQLKPPTTTPPPSIVVVQREKQGALTKHNIKESIQFDQYNQNRHNQNLCLLYTYGLNI